jgi:predicted transglutaminase-like cysteine proteinase
MFKSVKKIIYRCLLVVILALPSVNIIAGFDARQLISTPIQKHHDSPAMARLVAWQGLMQTLQGLPELEQLQQVNRFFNQLQFVDDIEQWGQQDYWATPVEFLTSNGGDCEDYVIAKYVTLVKLGVAKDKLRLTYVKTIQLKQAHMVLSYLTASDAVPLVLDNLTSTVTAATERSDLYPIYSFNESGMWLAKAQGGGRYLRNTQRLDLWLDLQQRL